MNTNDRTEIREELKIETKKVLMLSTGDLLIGEVEPYNDENVYVITPYSIYDMGKGPAVVPYMLPMLMEPMEEVRIRIFDIMWAKALKEFPQVEAQYISATTGIETDTTPGIIYD